MMANNEDRCSQCQEYGHIARNCPNIRCFECDEYGHIVIDCPHQIPPLGTSAKHHQSKSHKDHHTSLVSKTAMRTGIGEVIPGHSHISTATAAQVIMIHIEAIPDHDIRIITTTPEAVQDAPVPHTGTTAIDLSATHHINHTIGHAHTEAHPHTTPEIEVAHVHVHPTGHQDKIQVGTTCTPANHTTKNTRVKIEDPHTDYYSSDDHSSN